MAIIRIQNLRAETIVGIYDHERERQQSVNIDIELVCDVQQAIKSDSMSGVVDYEKICRSITDKVKNCRFRLIETLAWHILETVMKDPRIQRGVVKVAKPNAISNASAVEVELSKSR